MVKATKISRWQRLRLWGGRHKVWASMAVLVLIVAALAVASAVTTQVQIRFERNRYLSAYDVMVAAAKGVQAYKPLIRQNKSCSYSDNGAVFSNKYLGCEIGLKLNYADLSIEKARVISDTFQSSVGAQGIDLRNNSSSLGTYDLQNYTFKYHGMSCGFTATYYSANDIPGERYSGAEQTGSDLYIDIGCSSPAKSEYFPVTDS